MSGIVMEDDSTGVSRKWARETSERLYAKTSNRRENAGGAPPPYRFRKDVIRWGLWGGGLLRMCGERV